MVHGAAYDNNNDGDADAGVNYKADNGNSYYYKMLWWYW